MRKNEYAEVKVPEIYKGDAKKQSSDEEIAQIGRVNGMMNLPASDDTELDYDQQEIVNNDRKVFKSCIEKTTSALMELRRESTLIVSKVMAISYESQAQYVKKSMKLSVTTYRKLEEQILEEYSRTQDVVSFCKKNLLDRMPILQKNRLNLYLQIIVMILIETLFNAPIFSEGTDGGLVSGALIALLVSIISVLMGFISGSLLLRYKNHKKSAYRKFAYVSTSLSALLALSFHLMTAHYREGIIALVAADASEGMAQADLSFTSAVLVIVGMAIWLAALLKGYSAFDPYVGYDSISRKLEEVRQNLKRTENEALTHSRKVLEQSEMTYKKNLVMTEGHKAKLFELFGLEQEIISRHADSIEYLNKESRKGIRQYRESNRQVRKSPSPKYFATYEDFFDPTLKGIGSERIDPKLGEKVCEHLKALLEKQESFNQYIFELKKSEEVSLNTELIKLKRSVLPYEERMRDDLQDSIGLEIAS